MLPVIPSVFKWAVTKAGYLFLHNSGTLTHSNFASATFRFLSWWTSWGFVFWEVAGLSVGQGCGGGIFYTKATSKTCLIPEQAAPLYSSPLAVWNLFTRLMCVLFPLCLNITCNFSFSLNTGKSNFHTFLITFYSSLGQNIQTTWVLAKTPNFCAVQVPGLASAAHMPCLQFDRL